jgi:hypothetical protein
MRTLCLITLCLILDRKGWVGARGGWGKDGASHRERARERRRRDYNCVCVCACVRNRIENGPNLTLLPTKYLCPILAHSLCSERELSNRLFSYACTIFSYNLLEIGASSRGEPRLNVKWSETNLN